MTIDPATDPILGLARQHAPTATFRAVIAAAVARSPSIDESLAQQQEAVAARNEARAGQLPVADVSLSTFKIISRSFSNDFDAILESSRPDHRSDAILHVQQSVFDFAAASRRVRAGNARIVAAAAATEDTGTQLALRAIAAWYSVYGYRALVRLGDAFAASQRSLRTGMEDRIRQGYAAPGDLAQIDGYIASADTQLADFRRSLAGAEAQYVALTGAAPPADLARAPEPDLSGLNAQTAAASSASLPAVRAARASAAASRLDARATKADEFPKLSASLDAGRYGIVETNHDYDIRGTVTLALRLGGGAVERTAQARARADGADAKARGAEIDAARDAGIAWSDVAALEQAREAIAANYIASRRSRDVLVERFRVSRGNLLDVIGADGNYFSVAARYIQTVIELDTARYTLLARTGRLLPALGIQASQWNRP